MRFKKSYLALVLSLFSFQSNTAVLTGGNASEASADTIAELVFISDNSSSMWDTAKDISDAMANVVNNLTCPGNSVFLRSEFLGFEDGVVDPTVPSTNPPTFTIFDESIITRLGIPSPSGYDYQAYHQATQLIAENYSYTPPSGGQKYVKGIVVVADGGSTTRVTMEYDKIFDANKALIDNDVILFAVQNNNIFPDAEVALKTMVGLQQQPAGTMPAGQGPFQDTGGSYTYYDAATGDTAQLEQDLQDIVCQAASVAAPTSTSSIPSSSVLTLLSLFGLISILVVRRIRR